MRFPKNPIYRILIFIILFVFVIFLLNFYQKEVKNFFYKISEPIQSFFWQTGQKTSYFFQTISEIKKLKKENEDLKLKIQELLTENVSLKNLKNENEALREALKIGLEKEFKLSLAQVIGKDTSQDFILINKGFENGITKGLPVITPQKILVGKIYEVYKNYSRIILISNKGSSFDGEVVEKEILGQVVGEGNLKVSFDLIPRDKEISEGDLVETSILGGIFPKGLLIGQINKVQKSDIQIFQKAELSLFLNLDKLETVFVILNF